MTNPYALELDPMHASFDVFGYPFSQDIHRAKYSAGVDKDIFATFRRVADAIAMAEPHQPKRQLYADLFYDYMAAGVLVPAGRILAGAGTTNRVTLVNCFVNETLADSMEGIMHGLRNTALTMQQGGGMGTDFSTLRPVGAYLSRTNSIASGPMPFMNTWDTMCKTIMSAGDRRGAMMGTMICTHPDVLAFIDAKKDPLLLRNFNVSVLVTDAFMSAVRNDAEWPLFFSIPPKDIALHEKYAARHFVDANGVQQYVYNVVKARELWQRIMRNTYDFAEPGVIFIDRINDLNNLQEVETIAATNPCVTGDTPILTKQGYVPIKAAEGLEVEIWNGKRWSSVTPFSTGRNALMELEFSNGQVLQCTPYHGFFQHGQRISASNLKIGDTLDWADMPVVDLPALGGYDYSQGFFAGDGNDGDVSSKVYSPKYPVIGALRGSFGEEQSFRGTWINWYHGEMLPRNSVPINGSIEEAITWLSGYLDADGCIEVKGQSLALTAASKDQKFLQDVGLMLTRLGCNCRIWARKDGGEKIVSGVKTTFQNTYNLMLNMHGVARLKKLGLLTYRLNLGRFWEPKGIANVGNRVTAVRQLQGHQETFCFTDPDLGAGVFNGVHTANCGEQPLPPHGACNLGHINVARLVRNPFKENADFDFVGFAAAVRLAQRFLDNVIDMSAYPLPEQAEEQQLKRRIGLGITGFADALIQLGLAYDSDNALAFADKLGSVLAHAAYEASCDLAQERGKFPLWGSINWAARPMINRFQDDLREKILEHGLRNGVLLTLAPVGTTSITYGNVSSGLEPNFAFQYTRKVRRQDGGFAEHKVESFIQRFAKHCLGNQEIDRKAWVDANDITPKDHLNVQSIFQYWVDASISKTINCPEDISFEDFQQVYLDAYELGCKGCTTYRPNSVTGSILSTETTDAKKLADKNVTAALKPIERPFALEGTTFKLDWAAFEAATYVHLTRTSDGKPFELFFNSKDQRHQEWMAALSLAMTSLFRLGVDVKFILEEFLQVTSTTVGWHQGKRYDSFIALLGGTLLEHIGGEIKQSISRGERCPECKQYTMTNKGGCMTCDSCGHSKCG